MEKISKNPDQSIINKQENHKSLPMECQSKLVWLKDKTYPCSISAAMDLVGGRYKAVILYHLKDQPQRFGELHQHLIQATESVLSKQLKQLEQDGLIMRQVFGNKPPLKTVYSLTDFGYTFLPVLSALIDWGNNTIAQQGKYIDDK